LGLLCCADLKDYTASKTSFAPANMANNGTTNFSSGGAYRVLMKKDDTSRRTPRRVRTSWRMVETYEAGPRNKKDVYTATRARKQAHSPKFIEVLAMDSSTGMDPPG
jgi:hypothetical protein